MTENCNDAPMQNHRMANGHCSAGEGGAVPDFRHPMDIEEVKWFASGLDKSLLIRLHKAEKRHYSCHSMCAVPAARQRDGGSHVQLLPNCA